MKGVIIFALCTVLGLQICYGLPPSSRFRREAEKNDALGNKRDDLYEYALDIMIELAKNTVKSHKEFSEKIVKELEKQELKTDALREHVNKFQKLIDEANKLTEIKDEKAVEKLFDLFTGFTDLFDYYDELKEPTEEEKLIKRLLKENNADLLSITFFIDFVGLRNKYEERIQEYIDSLTSDEKKNELKFIEWFNSFKNSKDIENYVDSTMKFFDFFEDDEE